MSSWGWDSAAIYCIASHWNRMLPSSTPPQTHPAPDKAAEGQRGRQPLAPSQVDGAERCLPQPSSALEKTVEWQGGKAASCSIASQWSRRLPPPAPSRLCEAAGGNRGRFLIEQAGYSIKRCPPPSPFYVHISMDSFSPYSHQHAEEKKRLFRCSN